MKTLKETKLLKLKELIATRKNEKYVFVINEDDMSIQYGTYEYDTFKPWFTLSGGFIMTHCNYCIHIKTQQLVTQIMEVQNEN